MAPHSASSRVGAGVVGQTQGHAADDGDYDRDEGYLVGTAALIESLARLAPAKRRGGR
jgi:hypothetical protein